MTLKSVAMATILGMALVGCSGGGGETTSGGDTKTTGTTGTAPSGGDTLKIGLVASLNGDLKPWGEDSDKGAKMAVAEINEAGGIGGKKVELIVEDSNSAAESGKTAAERLIAKGCVAVVGEVASGITAQIANAATAEKVPVVAVGATKTELPGIGEYVFRVCYTDDLQGPVMATFARESLGLKRVALVTDNKQPYSQYLSKTFRDSFVAQGGQIIDEQFYQSKDTQFGPMLTQLKAKNPDGLFLSGYFTEVGPIARQAREAGINAKMMGGDGWDSAEILTSGGDAILGSYFCNHYNDKEDRAEVKTFLEKWGKSYNGATPGTTMGALGYDAVALVIDAMKRAKDPTKRPEVLTAISETENFPGVSGSITLKGAKGNPAKRALVVELTKEGQVYEQAYEVKDVKGMPKPK